MENEIKPGDKVICSLFPERGEGEATMVSESLNKVFIVWGEFNSMLDKEYAVCTLEQAKKAGMK